MRVRNRHLVIKLTNKLGIIVYVVYVLLLAPSFFLMMSKIFSREQFYMFLFGAMGTYS